MGGPPPDPMTARLMAEKSRLDPSLTQVHQIVDEGFFFYFINFLFTT